MADRTRAPGLTVNTLLLLTLALVVFASLARPGDPVHPFIDTDLWWHLANGRYILGHGVPVHDIYSHTAVGHVWVVHEWLSDVSFYLLYQVGGFALLAVLTAAAVVVGMALVMRALRQSGLGHMPTVGLALVLFFAASTAFGARPQVVNFLLVAVLCALLARYRRAPGRWIWALVPGFVLWANLHGGYVVGVGLLALFTAGEAAQARWPRLHRLREGGVDLLEPRDLRRLWVILPLAYLAGLFTPATYRTLGFAAGTLSSSLIQGQIVEWSSPDFHAPQGMAVLLCILVLVAGGLVGGRVGTPASDPTFLAWGLVTLAMALTSTRHIQVFAVAGAPMMGGAVAALLGGLGVRPRRLRPANAAMARLNVTILAAEVLLASGYVAWNLRPQAVAAVTRSVEPVAATDWLLAHRTEARRELFNNYGWGGWLDWKANPAYPVFIDGRVEVFGDRVFGDYLRVESLSANWADVLERHHVRTILVPPGDRLGLVLPAHGWRAVYQDPEAVVYTLD
ncbi:MAG: hypothetical protein ABR573_00330 [Candidatus Dormibacteria bacterium]